MSVISGTKCCEYHPDAIRVRFEIALLMASVQSCVNLGEPGGVSPGILRKSWHLRSDEESQG